MHSRYKSSYTILIIFSFIFSTFLLGCGGGSSSNSDSDVFSANLSTGKISYEGSGDKHILFASVTGANIEGGWIVDPNGDIISNSNLERNALTNTWEVILERDKGGFVGGTYILKYKENSNTLELIKPNLQWTSTQMFYPSPTMNWDPIFKTLSVSSPILNGSSVYYYLRIYRTGFGLMKETSKYINPEILENLYLSGLSNTYSVMLIGEVRNGDEIVENVIYYFSERTFSSL